ncbi:hypothetical protein TTHERM_01014680 (macronuclear) [Tetrahymena thermophila SB210]|uniref:Uncharacterized protein n=1 Tax=Tetrahymena thermophila (strain SB210) TaxID=312017 RepID=Q22CW8_TETTS|nr:hypothetical protein TTHERM_01014680 [Tetrahymena thermophila SB210]EAR83151.1 hypothetical protein TTHERM_01014680 [Tetrahymena thermophila SB210]|eukprot:XP_001030814.1 hypothetical protein TTHERM_01014680 [Tetrahymena thermophila SB210]
MALKFKISMIKSTNKIFFQHNYLVNSQKAIPQQYQNLQIRYTLQNIQNNLKFLIFFPLKSVILINSVGLHSSWDAQINGYS